jgi:hypothetical protein
LIADWSKFLHSKQHHKIAENSKASFFLQNERAS